MSLQVFLIERRLERGLQRREVARHLGVSTNTVKHWETEESKTVLKLAYVLKVASLYEVAPIEVLQKAQADWESSTTRPKATFFPEPVCGPKREKYKTVLAKKTGRRIFKENDYRYMVTCAYCSKPMPILGSKRIKHGGSFCHVDCQPKEIQ